jgi:hypothetical protein
MESKSKSEIARQNGSKSRGPITPEGKAKSSQNAHKHGLCAKFETLPHENQPLFNQLLASFEDTYRPATELESDLVRTLAITRWRLRRIPDLETAILANELALAEEEIEERFAEIDDASRLGYAFTKLADSSGALTLLLRYETSLTRAYDRTLKQLADLQKLRNEPTGPREADRPPCPQPTTAPVSAEPDPAPMPVAAPSESSADKPREFILPPEVDKPRTPLVDSVK